jgi:radical SAM superfamily enzyme YgiQ (UPF0313 family)
VKVLLISTNRLKPTRSLQWIPVAPLGLMYIASSLRQAGHDIELLDLCFIDRPESAVVDALTSYRPDVIGLSFRNIETMAYFHNVSFLDGLKSVIDVCRTHSTGKIILGGSGFSVMPLEILKYTGTDLGIIGEAERNLPQLLSRIENKKDYSDIPGIVSLDNGCLHGTPPDHTWPIDDLSPPARDLIDHDRYVQGGGTANLQTKRGCPFECIYCTYPLIEGRNVRCRPPVQVAEEFRNIYERHGLKHVYIVDNQFNYPPEHAQSICEELIAIRDDVHVWWECMLNPGFLNEKLVFMLKMARCRRIDLSIESASDTVLRNLGKNFCVQDIRNAIHLLKEYKIAFGTWILFGGPGETKDTIRETLNFLADLAVPEVLFSIGLRVCPRTRLEKTMRRSGAITEDQDLLNPVFHLSLNPEEIVEIIKPYCLKHKDWRIAAFEFALI